MINNEFIEKYVKELKSQNKQVAKVVKELDDYFFNFLKMSLEYVFTLYEDKDISFSIEPCGDYYNNTYHLNLSPITYLVTYNVKRQDMQEYLNNKILKERYTTKYLQKIIGNTPAPNLPTNSEIATRIYKFMDRFIDLDNKSFCKFGTIRYGLERSYNVKIVVAYKFEDGSYVFTDNNKYIEIDFQKVQKNIKSKEKETKKGFSKLCALFKSFETELLCAQKISEVNFQRNYFVEELLYNLPNDIFLENDVSLQIGQAIKYLTRMNLYKLKRLDDEPLTDRVRINYYKNFIKHMKLFNEIGTSIILQIFE